MALSLKSILSPETSVLLGVANGAIVAGIYSGYLPPFAFVRASDPHDDDVEKSRKAAAWTSATFLGFMYLLTRDRNSFLIGGLVLVAVDYTAKHANGMDPTTGRLADDSPQIAHDDSVNVYPVPDYATADDI